MYNDKVMEIFQNPKNVGELKGANGIGTVGNESCGDIMKLYLKINDKEVIENATFKTFGCAAAIVSSSVATEMIKGKTVDEALQLENEAIIDYLGGLPDNKIHCSILAKEAITEAVKDFRKKQAKLAKKAAKEGAKEQTKPATKETAKATEKSAKQVKEDKANKMAKINDATQKMESAKKRLSLFAKKDKKAK